MPRPAEGALPLRHAAALGLLHGPAELLPVSSSAHVALAPWLLRWPFAGADPEVRKAFEVALHAGTAAALLLALRAEVAEAAVALDRRRLLLTVLSALPPAAAALLLERRIEEEASSPGAISVGLLAGSAAMVFAEVATGRGASPARSTARARADAGALDGLALGLAQACAL